MKLVEVTNVSKSFGDIVAVNDLNLGVGPREVVGLLGENGAGKSTLISLLAGISRPDHGNIRVCGADPTQTVAAGVGIVFGNFLAPDPDSTGRKYLEYCRALRDAAPGVNVFPPPMAPPMDRPIRTLSPGNQRKLEIERAFLETPRLLILDEPTRELDLRAKSCVWSQLNNAREAGCGILIASHDAEEIVQVCDRVIVLREGKAIWETNDCRTDAKSMTQRLLSALGP